MFFCFNCLNNITNNFRASKTWWLLRKVTLLAGVGIISWGSFIIGSALERDHSISKIPNSCFVDAVTFASNADYILSNEKTWAHVYAFTFHYKADLTNTSITIDKITKEFVVELPRIHGHAICIFEHGGMLWVYDNNFGSSVIGRAGNRNEYTIRITKYIEDKYKVIVISSLLLDDDRKTRDFFGD